MPKQLQVAFHVGVHTTDEDRLARSLSQNREVLRAQGIELSANKVNEPILNEALSSLAGGVASEEMEDVVLDALLEGESPRRLILSRPTLMGVQRRALDTEGLMMFAGSKMLALANVLPHSQTEFFMALKNPATLITHIVTRAVRGYDELMGGADPLSKRWAPALRQAVSELRGRRLVVWCNEDMPMIFPEVLRRLAGVAPDTELRGEDRLLRSLLRPEGIALIRERILPEMTVSERRRATEQLLAEHAKPEEVYQSIDFPGWTQELVEQMTDAYHQDIAEIAALPGVEFIFP